MPFKLPEYTWGKDRELCKRCKHYSERQEDEKHGSNHTILLCAVNPQKSKRKVGTCIDNRTRGPCGKEGKLFEPMEQGE